MNQHARTHHAHDLDWATMVAFAELEAEVLMPLLAEATSVVAGLSDRNGMDIGRVLDVGSGPGVGTCVLAGQFTAATVVAADGSSEMLANVAARAERLGLSERVQTRLTELPDGLDALGRADVVWASMVLHHVGDEGAALRGLRSRLEPGGLLALVEFGDPLRVLPEEADLGRPGLWQRLDAARATWLADMRAGRAGTVPSGDLPTTLEAAGLGVLVDRMLTVNLDAPLDASARQMVAGHLQLMREHVEPYAEAADIDVLNVLVDDDDPDGIMNRGDALLHTSRHLYVARAVPLGGHGG